VLLLDEEELTSELGEDSEKLDDSDDDKELSEESLDELTDDIEEIEESLEVEELVKELEVD